jgi:hypothetical protein
MEIADMISKELVADKKAAASCESQIKAGAYAHRASNLDSNNNYAMEVAPGCGY